MFPHQIDVIVRRQQEEYVARAARERQAMAIRPPVPQWRLWLGNELIRLGMRIKASTYVTPVYRNVRTPNPGC